VLACIALANTSGLTAQCTQIVELGTTDASALHDLDMIHNRRVQRENAFDANAKRGFAHGDRFTNA
jgi:hypothetical protein